jgi:hypothetical protein
MLYPVELGVRGFSQINIPACEKTQVVYSRFTVACWERIIMPENGRQNKAGSHSSVTFGLTFRLK